MAQASVSVGDHYSKTTRPLTEGDPTDAIIIETEDGEQKYRIVITENGSLKISSESFENRALLIKPVVSNVIEVQGGQW